MTTQSEQPDEDPVPEDFIEERQPWEEDFATDLSPGWEPRFEEEEEAPPATPPPPKEPPVKAMGVREVARSADGLTVLNTIEILPPFDLSI